MNDISALNIDMDELVTLRRWLHARPEVSRQETKTSKYMQDYLKDKSTPDDIIPLAGAGFAAVYNGKMPGKTVLIRCELDALPIHEINYDIEYRSIYDGVGHKCGHDGHMTILAGLANVLSNERPESGRVVLLFQPDEETGTGARECCNHPNFKKIEPDYAFALHNFPSFPKNQILCKVGTFTSSVKFIACKLSGKEAHSAMPETGITPAFAIAEITQMTQDLQNEFDKSEEYALIVPVHFDMGVSSSGVMPGYGEAHYTIRTCRNEVVDDIWNVFQKRAAEIAQKHGLKIEYEIIEDFAASENDEDVLPMIEKAASDNGLSYLKLEKPFRGGEDFGEIIKRYKGAMFGLGSGEDMPELHNPDYDFPEEIIPSGILMFKNLIDQVLGAEKVSKIGKAA